jgi:chromate transporter
MNELQDKQVDKIPSLANLFISFLLLGATSFGGPAMIAYIHKLAVNKKHWVNEQTFQNGIALCQIIPGATAMQMSAYVGLEARGLMGAFISYVGFGLSAFILMMTFAALYTYLHNLPIVVSAFNGLRVIIVSIVLNAAISIGRNYFKSWRNIVIAVIAGILFGFGVNPFIVIILSALLGFLLYKPKSFSQLELNPIRKQSYYKSIIIITLVAIILFILLFFVNRKLFDLAFLMFRIDLFAFGGGFSSVTLMFHEVVDVRKWMDSSTFLNGIALGQVTPGPIVITATFVGYLMFGIIGATISTISIFLPSFLIVVGITPYFNKLCTLQYFNKATGGVLCSFVGLLLSVSVKFGMSIPWNLPRVLIGIASFIALFFNIDILWVVVAGTIISILIF